MSIGLNVKLHELIYMAGAMFTYVCWLDQFFYERPLLTCNYEIILMKSVNK